MSFTNPTPLRIGMVGTLFGKRFRVAGRVVLGMEQAGRVYYWDEFNLENVDGEPATLVFEANNSGANWRLFTLFQPECPITAEDAASKRLGDPLNLDGTDVHVTLLAKSRIYHIEGQGPEGEAVGEEANYFNAENGPKMVVVSWTGDEVECYRGVELSSATVKLAFNLSGPMPENSARFLDSTGFGRRRAKVIVGVLLAVLILLGFMAYKIDRGQQTVLKMSAPAMPLKLGSSGTLEAKTYRILGHSLVEIAQVGLRYQQHEFYLFDQEGSAALLICGFRPGTKEWFLFSPLQPAPSLTAQETAAKRAGESVNLDEQNVQVLQLFRSSILHTASAELMALGKAAVFYGFNGVSGRRLFLVRWNDGGIAFYQGKALKSKEVANAFH
jgi:Domain of unknown function (DUF4178)